ncbi:hypothetical protein EYF80_026041 [Liparis tanakae]|uniref:Uncharacterized protein n=1 Tax=Liparis tanakae TaxID=230148 RepID=A0A4Z2HFM9_9TELE|nr:hypothetical protein EYF80_026041 [Liparis tanakae]
MSPQEIKPGTESVSKRLTPTLPPRSQTPVNLRMADELWALIMDAAGSAAYLIKPWHSQFLAKASDLGFGISQLHREVLPALGPPHTGRVTGRLESDYCPGISLKEPTMGLNRTGV